MAKYILMHGTFFAIDDNALCHAAKSNVAPRDDHKYLKREWKNGRWEYTYKTDAAATKKKAVTKEDSIAKSTAAKNALLKERDKAGGGDRGQILAKQNAAVKAQKEASAAIREQARQEAMEKKAKTAKAATEVGKQVALGLAKLPTSDTAKQESAKTTTQTETEEKKKSGGKGSGSKEKVDKLGDAEKYQKEVEGDLAAAKAYYEEVLARFEEGKATQEEVDAARARYEMFEAALATATEDVNKIKADAAKKKKKKKKTNTVGKTAADIGKLVAQGLSKSAASSSTKNSSLDRYKKAAAEKVKKLLDAKEKREKR